ncbi:hypothetical protein PFISCL1PPCAC_971, partial [Pristionchus fissidentatus]
RNAVISWAGSLPTLFLLIFVIRNPVLLKRYKDLPSSLFVCSLARTSINYISLLSQAVEPVLVLMRYRRIVRQKETPIWMSTLVAGFFSVSMISLALILFYSVATVLFSVLTAVFLRKHVKKMTNYRKNSLDELHISVGIVARSAVPMFFWTIRALSVLLSGDWSLPRVFYTAMDTISYGSVACSTFASCAPIPAFRRALLLCLL